jgi:hypothetical protein
MSRPLGTLRIPATPPSVILVLNERVQFAFNFIAVLFFGDKNVVFVAIASGPTVLFRDRFQIVAVRRRSAQARKASLMRPRFL